MQGDTSKGLNGDKITTPKNTSHTAQKQTFFKYLQVNEATASMVTDATGIPQKCLTRYKRDFEKNNQLWELKRTYCKKTKCLAWYLTTDPSKAPTDPQLNLFDQKGSSNE